MTAKLSERRFCVCGWSVFGTPEYRRSKVYAHRIRGVHDKRERENAIKGADALAWSALDGALYREESSE